MKLEFTAIVASFPATVILGWLYVGTWQMLPDSFQPGVYAGGAHGLVQLVLFLLICGLATIVTWFVYAYVRSHTTLFRSNFILFVTSWFVSIAVLLNPLLFAELFRLMYG